MNSNKPHKIAFLTEDLSLPLDEGMKKFNHAIITYIRVNFTGFRIYSRRIDDPEIDYSGITRKSFISPAFLWNIRKYNPELIIYSPLASGTLSSFLRLFLLKMTCRGSRTVLINLQRRQHNALSRLIVGIAKPDIVIVFSKREYDYFNSINNTPLIAKTGVNLARFVPVSPGTKLYLRQKYGLQEHEKILLHVGHINHGRNIEILLHPQDIDCRILVVGSTSTEVDYSLKEKLVNAGVKVIDSYIEHIEEIYQMSDAYVFPVLNDHSAIEFPLSVLEAMACNLPVVTTKYGSLPDFFKPSSSFAFFETVEELKSQIKNVLRSDCNNRQLVAEGLSWEIIFNEIFEKIK